MGKNTSISLGNHFEDFISASIETGTSSSASAVVRTVLSLLESQESKLKELRNALIDGENSQMIENFDAKKHLDDLHRKFL